MFRGRLVELSMIGRELELTAAERVQGTAGCGDAAAGGSESDLGHFRDGCGEALDRSGLSVVKRIDVHPKIVVSTL